MPFLSLKKDKNCKFLYIIIYWILEILIRLSMYLLWNDYFQFVEDDGDNEYIYLLLLNVADLLSFFLLLRKICLKGKIEYENVTNMNKKKKIAYLIVLSILDLLARSNYFCFHEIIGVDNKEVSQKSLHDFLIIFDISMRFIFYYYFFMKKGNTYLKKHQKISAIFTGIVFLFLISNDILSIIDKGKYDLKYCFYYIVISLPRAVLFPLVDTFGKILMERQYILPGKYLRYRGIIEFVLIWFIMTPILLKTSLIKYDSEFFNLKNIIISLIYTFVCFIKSYLLLYVIYYFSSLSVSFLIISEPLSGSIYNIILFIKDKEYESELKNIAFLIIEIICFILVGIGTMIYEEIIIINKWGLNLDTDQEIIDRADLDIESILCDDQENDYDE